MPRKKPWSIPTVYTEQGKKILARVKELEKTQENSFGDDKENTRQGGGDDYE